MHYPARRHLDSFYIWETSVYEVLVVVAARCVQLVNDYSPDSDVKVVPILIKRIQGRRSFLISRCTYHPLGLPPSSTAMSIETVSEIM